MKPLRIQVVEHPHPELNEFGFIVPGLGDAAIATSELVRICLRA
jgi:hypothetical protein